MSTTVPSTYTPKAKQSFVAEFVFGALHPFYAIGYVFRTSKLWKYLFVPCLLMMASVLVGIILLYFYATSLHVWLQSIVWAPDKSSTDILSRLSIFLYDQGLYLVIWCLGILTSYGVGMILAPLFAEGISTDICKREGWYKENTDGLLAQTKTTIFSIVESMISLALYIALMLNLFFLSFLPFVALITPIVGAIVTTFFVSKELFEIPMAEHQLSLKQRLAYLIEYKWMVMGFGGVAALMALIPLYNFFIFPVLIVGSTLLYHRRPHQPEAS